MLTKHADNLWSVAQPHRLGLFELGRRMTIVRLSDGRLLLHSPVPLDDDDARTIAALGRVGFIAAPNLMHHRFVPDLKARFPEARVLGVPGLADKRPDLALDAELREIPELARDLDLLLVEGMPKLNEVALVHRASRTLVLADLIFHFAAAPNLATGLYLRLTGAVGRPATTAYTRSLIRDRVAFRRSVDALLSLDFDRLLVPHRDVVEHGARNALAQAFNRA